MGNRLCAAVAVVAFKLFALAFAAASIAGSISGVVSDSSGAVVSGASVVATDTQTDVRTTVTSDAKGFYSLPTLAIGNYNWLLPFDRFATEGLVGKLIGGWSLSGISNFATGLPITLTENGDNALIGAFAVPVDVPNFAGGHMLADTNPRDGNPYFDRKPSICSTMRNFRPLPAKLTPASLDS
jgi:hypothetical protein